RCGIALPHQPASPRRPTAQHAPNPRSPVMSTELYADGIGEITVTGTIVRIDLMSLSATERDEKNSPKPVFRQRVIMPVDAFANAVDLMQKALTGLVDAGAVRRINSGPSGGTEAVNGRGETQQASNASPNFN